MAEKFEESLHLITPGLLFEELGVEYIGPVDGHDMESIVSTLKIAKEMGKPVIVHAQTTKGKGYEIAEGAQEKWHGVSAFDLKSGEPLKKSGTVPATQIFGDMLHKMATEDKKIVGVTAAMPSGTGLSRLIESFPDRFWDVAIAEQHAVTSMGPLAKEGFKPFCTIYSTFLQRGYDQVIHDIALMDLGVTFALDRAGIVGEDGETHQGVFDISYLRPIPNIALCAPYNKTSMEKLMQFAAAYPSPLAFRYPRGVFMVEDSDVPDYVLGKADLLQEGKDILLIGYGDGVGRAIQTAALLKGLEVAILDLRFVKPLDEEMLIQLAATYTEWFVFSDSVRMGGVGSAIGEFLMQEGIGNIALTTFEYPDTFIVHGNTTLVEQSLGILPEQLAEKIKNKINKEL
jgi:1-deoxy-D-xylulose-5-phosphate synthase